MGRAERPLPDLSCSKAVSPESANTGHGADVVEGPLWAGGLNRYRGNW